MWLTESVKNVLTVKKLYPARTFQEMLGLLKLYIIAIYYNLKLFGVPYLTIIIYAYFMYTRYLY